jgi:excisionase family DNA binding protein
VDFYSAAEAARILKVSKRRVLQLLQEGELEGGQDESGRWRVAMHSVHAAKEARSQQETSTRPSDALEWIERVNILERELGRLEGRMELSERTESTLQESLQRERERADKAEAELQAERSKGFWARLFGA